MSKAFKTSLERGLLFCWHDRKLLYYSLRPFFESRYRQNRSQNIVCYHTVCRARGKTYAFYVFICFRTICLMWFVGWFSCRENVFCKIESFCGLFVQSKFTQLEVLHTYQTGLRVHAWVITRLIWFKKCVVWYCLIDTMIKLYSIGSKRFSALNWT